MVRSRWPSDKAVDEVAGRRRPRAAGQALPRAVVSSLTGALVVTGCCSVMAACGSSGRSPAALGRTCQDVSAVLSDGPDPTADPVGYAEAQILPLRQVRTNDVALAQAIGRLDAAYQEMFHSDGAAPAEQAVARASARLDAVCPGAAP